MSFIKDLSKKRQKWIEANRENNFEDGIKKLLTELYPDNAHFIYELLQNAEDAQATKVKFTLSLEGLEFQHDGKRQFNEDNIESITSIGQTTKKDDFNQIGKFGVGFKAVFSYTQTPQVYSGKYAFEIKDLVCPEEIPQIPQISRDKSNSTFFLFPFNHPQKTKENCVQEIEKTLINLPDNTILFLRNIKEIIWEIDHSKKQNGYIKIFQLQKENHFLIEKKSNEIQKTNWLRFTREISIKNENEPNKKSFIAIAFRLEILNESNELQIDRKVSKGDVSIFFPAEKENSGLKFFLHAPFASTVARDSIQNKRENEILRDLLVELLVDSISKIKEFNLLDRNFLEILPNYRDSLSIFYLPFRNKIVELFQTKDYTPTWNGKYLSANNLIQADNEMKNVINKETILNHLIDDEKIDWAINAQRGSRSHDFLESLKINRWSWRDLLDNVGSAFEQPENATKILSDLPDEWLQKFYVLLGKAKEESPYSWHSIEIEDAHIIRLQDENYGVGKNTYFETEILKKGKGLSIVKPQIYQSGKDQKQNEKAKAFLELIGVKEFEPRDEIKIILEKHYKKGNLKFTHEENLKHLKKFIKFLAENPQEVKIFSNYYILRTEKDDESTRYYSMPSQIFIDTPYESTKLSNIENYLNEHNNWKLWSGYATQIKNQKNFVSFIKDIGAVSKLKINKISVQGNLLQGELKQDVLRYAARETAHGINDDYQINKLGNLLSEKNREISQLIWETISKADRRVLKANYRPNSHYSERNAPSQLVHTLKQFAWIPNKEGIFHKPEDTTREMLPDDFPFDNRNGWLDAIGVGKQAEKNKADEQQKIERAAKQLGFESAEEAKRARQWLEMSDEEKSEFEEFQQKKQLEKQQKAVPSDDSNKNDFFDEKDSDESKKNNEKSKSADKDDKDKTNLTKQPATSFIFNSADEIEYLVKSRPYQRDFKSRMKNLENKCRVTGITNIEFLIASHIKPVRDCTDAEKVDENNGFLLSPHIDKLFDKGWISFGDNGNLLCKDEIVKEVMKVWRLDFNKNVGTFNEKQKEYLAYHHNKFGFDL